MPKHDPGLDDWGLDDFREPDKIDHIEWWADPHANAVYYRHVGCDTPHRRWLVPMDDCPLPYDETTEECAQCCIVRPLVAGKPF